VREPEVLTAAINPGWDRLRNDPRFIAMVKKIGLPQERPEHASAQGFKNLKRTDN